MKANKIVFSSIAALALASSAFGAASAGVAKLDTGNHWYNQLNPDGSSPNTKLADLGWGADTVGAIGAAIGADTAATANTITKHFADATDKDKSGTAASNKVKFTYADITDTLPNSKTITDFVTAKDNSVSGLGAAGLMQDYIKSESIKVKAQKMKDLLELVKLSASDIQDNTDLTAGSGSVTLALKTDTAENVKKLYDIAISSVDSTTSKTDIEGLVKADGTIDKTQLLTKVVTMLNTNDNDLKEFGGANNHKLADLDAVIKNANTIQGTIKEQITKLVASSQDADKAAFVRAQLDDAVRTLESYKKAQAQIDFANARIDAAIAQITMQDNTGIGLDQIAENTYKTAAAGIDTPTASSTPEQIKKAMKDKVVTAATTTDSQGLVGSGGATDFTNFAPGTSIATTIDYKSLNALATNTLKTDAGNFDATNLALGGFNSVTDFQTAVSKLKRDIDNGRAIDTEALKNINKVLTKNGDASSQVTLTITIDASGTGTADKYNQALAKIDALDFKNFNDSKDALKQIYADLAKSSDMGAVKQITQTTDKALGESLAQVAKSDAGVASALDALKALQLQGADDAAVGAMINATTINDRTEKEFNVSGGDITANDELYKKYGVDSTKSDAEANLLLAIIKQEGIGDATYNDSGSDKPLSGLKSSTVASQKSAILNALKARRIEQHNAKIQTAANKVASAVAESKKDSLAVEGLSTLNIQLNNMNKRLGEIRGMDGEIGVWLRTWGGKMSADHDSFKYYSTQLGADKKTAMKDGDLYLGVLVGYDNVKSDIKSNAYSVGAYASYIDNSGFFADGVMKFVSTKNERSGFDLSNQQTLLASIEGGYRFDMSDGFYVEPSLEFVTGHVGEYKSKEKGSETTLKVDSFTPVVFKPQVFVGGSADAFTYRAGIGGVLSMQGQDASVTIANLAQNLNDAPVNGSSTVKLSKNNHGFASIGGSFKASENFRINLGVERSFGGDLTNDYEVNMTLRYGF